MVNDVNPNLQYHAHTGTDSPKIDGVNLVNAPQSVLTTASTGGLSSADAVVIDNIRTRVNEIEARLRDLHLIQ